LTNKRKGVRVDMMREDEKVDIELLYRLRSQYKRLDQITWTIRDAQERFPVGTDENEMRLLKVYLALLSEVEDILRELKELKREYERNPEIVK